MIRISIVVAVSAVLTCSSAAQTGDQVRAEFCTVIQQPEKFAGKVIEVRALQTKLKNGEWGLLGDCWPPVLLALPRDVSPTPEFTLEESPALTQLLASRNERVSFTATFVGRFDWSGAQSPSGRSAKRRPFGKSKLNMRFVLQRVSDSQRIVLPYK